MTVLQPSELSLFFNPEQQVLMQNDIKKEFSGTKPVGVYMMTFHTSGIKDNYLVSFIIEQPIKPFPFIIEVCVDLFSRGEEEHLKEVNERLKKVWDSPNRIISTQMNNLKNNLH